MSQEKLLTGCIYQLSSQQMSRLSDTLQRTLDELQLSAAQLERSSELPAMSIKNIFNGSHPRSDRFDKLLSSIPSLHHQVELLIAYVLDDSPSTYTPGLEIVLKEHLLTQLRLTHHSSTSIIQEDVTPYIVSSSPTRPLTSATKARLVLDQMRLRLDAGDTILADWLADTGTLLTAPHLSAAPGQPSDKDVPYTYGTPHASRQDR